MRGTTTWTSLISGMFALNKGPKQVGNKVTHSYAIGLLPGLGLVLGFEPELGQEL